DGIAVRQIETAYSQRAFRRVDPALDVACRLVGLRVRQAACHDLDGMKREQGDPVEAFLAYDLDLVAAGLDLEPGKLRFQRLQLLQDDDVRLGALQPVEEVAGPLADGVDVPGRDFHRGRFTR